MNTEIYSLATCPGTKYSGDTITLKATPRDGIGPYYMAFKKDGIIINPSRLGSQPNPITSATENLEITRTYTLNDEDVRNALTGAIDFSVFIRGSCPTGGGLQFDGIDDYVDAGNDASLGIIGTITVSARIKANDQAEHAGIVWKKQQTYSPDYGLMILGGGTETITFRITNSTGGTGQPSTTGQLSLGVWHYLVGTYDGATVILYIDGANVAQAALTGSIANSGEVVRIGSRDANAQRFSGTIDEVRIYNRALSPTDVLDLYNGSTPRNGLVLEHIYSLGNANDLSGYGNNGIPINGPVFIPNACMDTCTIAIGCIAPVCNFVVT